MLIRAVQLLVQNVVIAAIVFLCAGTLRWSNGWAFLGLSLAAVLANGLYLARRNPEVIAERGRRHEGTRSFDKALMSAYTVIFLALFVLAGLDGGRWHWATLGWPWSLLGAVLLVTSMVPIAGAMAVNRNLETTVRIQSERGHQVAAGGPYRFVRHPMYVGMLIQLPASALVLGSGWALVPALACAILLVVRTVLEDRTLRRDLPGYAEYAQRTRYRLLPGVW